MNTLPYKRRPCKNCPFKKNTMKGWLGKDRMTEILQANTFVCHKTVDYEKTDDDGRDLPDPNRLQCAGHMLIKGLENEFVRTANNLGIELDLNGKDEVFSSKEDCINHHS